MGDLKKKIKDEVEELKNKTEDALEKAIDSISVKKRYGSTPFVGDVHYRGHALFAGESIFLNRDAAQDDGEVTYMHLGEKKFTTPAIWNASIADQKYAIK